MKSLLDPTFQYTPSVGTDLRKTFARVRQEQAELAEQKAVEDAALKARVFPIPMRAVR